MITNSFSSIEDAALYLTSGNPELESDFFISIDTPMSNVPTKAPIVGFSFPELGLAFSSSADLYGHAVPSIQLSTIQIKAIHSYGDLNRVLQRMWESQFSAGGAISYDHERNLPSFYIYKKTGQLLVACEKCHLTHPVPNVNMESASHTVYSFTVSFDTYTLFA